MSNMFYILYAEKWWQSVISDIASEAVWILPLFINHYFLGSKWYIDIFFLLMGLLHCIGITNKIKTRFNSKEELYKFLQKN